MKFTVEETNFMCVFRKKSRMELIENIGKVLKHVEDDDMEELAIQIVDKLKSLKDEEYLELNLLSAEDYKEPLFF